MTHSRPRPKATLIETVNAERACSNRVLIIINIRIIKRLANSFLSLLGLAADEAQAILICKRVARCICKCLGRVFAGCGQTCKIEGCQTKWNGDKVCREIWCEPQTDLPTIAPTTMLETAPMWLAFDHHIPAVSGTKSVAKSTDQESTIRL